MAIIEQGILGAFRGKCGSVIGYVRNGVACVRAMPLHYRDRRSALQLKNRNRFTMVMKIMSVVKEATTLGFRKFASEMTEMNVATQLNYYSLVRESNEGFKYDFSGLLLSRGPVERLSCLMSQVSGHLLSLVWDGTSILGGNNDKVTIALLNGSRMEMKMFRNIASRSEGATLVAIPDSWSSDEVHCYVMVQRRDDWSESSYAGTVSQHKERNTATTIAHSLTCETADSESSRSHTHTHFLSHQSAVKVPFGSGLKGKKKSPD